MISEQEHSIATDGILSISFEKTYGGFDIKVPSSRGLLGTLHVTNEGFSFSRPNKKGFPKDFIEWERLDAFIKAATAMKQV